MYKLKERKGFTLAELLIVVAIIAVLVAIAIPVFTSQLEKSREATDVANVRSAYAQCVTDYLTNGGTATSMTVTAQAKQANWQTSPEPKLVTQVNGTEGSVAIPAKGEGGTYTVHIDANGSVSIE